jgi:hypothetical protein
MTQPQPPSAPEQDLVDLIAEGLPMEQRAGYYREMRYLPSLAESDEMLRILRTIQWHTVIALQVPAKLAAQAQQLDRGLRDNAEALQRIHQRLERVGEDLVERVSAEAIANQLYESLRQQFVNSTIPQTGQALAVASEQIQGAVDGLERATPKVVRAHQWAASEAQKAVNQMEAEISQAAAVARQAPRNCPAPFCMNTAGHSGCCWCWPAFWDCCSASTWIGPYSCPGSRHADDSRHVGRHGVCSPVPGAE